MNDKFVIVGLKYIKCKLLKNWDEYQTIGGINGSITDWSEDLPADVCTAAVTYMMPTYLLNRKIRTGSNIEIVFLDMVLEFSVKISIAPVLASGEEGGDVRCGEPASVHDGELILQHLEATRVSVVWPSDSIAASPSKIPADVGEPRGRTMRVWCSFSRKLFRYLYFLHAGLFSDAAAVRPWSGVKVVTITGLEGCGKSTSLAMVLGKLVRSTPGVIPLMVSATDTGEAGRTDLPCCAGLTTDAQLDALATFGSAIASVQTGPVAVDAVNLLLETLALWCSSAELQRRHALRLVLVLDNLDDLLPYCSDEGANADANVDDDLGAGTESALAESGALGELLTQRVVLLRRLLAAASEPACTATLLLLGVSRLQTTKDLRRFALTRGFEANYTLRCPTLDDFLSLFRHFLSTATAAEGVSFEELGGAGGLDEWAARLAGLTASRGRFVPADAEELVGSVLRLHRGSSALRALASPGPGGVDTTSGNEPMTAAVVAWSTALEVCSTFTSRQVRSQQASSASTLSSHSSSGGGATSWEDFGGYQSVKTQLQRLLRLCAPAPSNRPPHPVTVPRGVLLHGPPGCGKTFLAGVVAAESRMGFVSVRSTELLSKWFGDTEASIRRVFAQARAAAPCLLFFDEFDAIACKRSGGGGGGEADAGGWRNRVLSTFLNELDGISGGGGGGGRVGELPGTEGAFLFGDSDIDCQSDLEGEEGAGGDTLLVLAACQDVSLIDEALLRPGRLHYHVALGLPDRTSVYDILRVKLRHVQLSASMDPASAHHGAAGHKVLLDHFADELMRHAPTPADVDSLCHRAVLLAIKDSAAAGGEVTVAVTANHLQLAVRELWG